MMSFKDYMEDVYSQLEGYTSDTSEKNDEQIYYNYDRIQIAYHASYFKKCYHLNLSAYKALLFFEEELELTHEDLFTIQLLVHKLTNRICIRLNAFTLPDLGYRDFRDKVYKKYMLKIIKMYRNKGMDYIKVRYSEQFPVSKN